MSIDRAVMAFAGLMVLLSLALSQLHSLYWLWLTAFVGLNLVQASFTGFCPAARMFKWLGLSRRPAFS
jgi:Inner membrane protein YgaP-like, transmembrane domain